MKYEDINIDVSTQVINIFTSSRNQQLVVSYDTIAHCHQIRFCHIVSLLDHDVDKNVIASLKHRLIPMKHICIYTYLLVFI